jgi:hypothetical protein
MPDRSRAPYDIPQSPLLRGGEKTLAMSQVPGYRKVWDRYDNLGRVPEETLNQIFELFGESGLFKLMFLCTYCQPSHFDHFHRVIEYEISQRKKWSTTRPVKLACDNSRLPEGANLAHFASNIVQPSLSRKLYNPGIRNGIVVYGIDGPRILVSHPFKGAGKEDYDVFTNSAEVVSGLIDRGFLGTFLFFDYLPGLSIEVYDTPAWLLWFSIISAHSDLVVYVTDKGDLSSSQKLEAEFTPDRIAKKIVRFEADELRSAQDMKETDSLERMYVIPGKGRPATLAEWNEMEAKFALTFIEEYYRDEFPADRIFQLSESGDVSEHPLNAFRWH